MADIAWVRKYRPSSFDDYMGDNVKNLVINRFKDRANIPNTIMLYGTRGTGKTSMARLLAKEIHCMDPVDGQSCGKCEMCQNMEEYITSTEAGVEVYGVTEVDAATTTGKSDLNDIIEDALIPPMYPLTYKILILDECHMLSKAAQNSLLKVFEEPPAHLVFILCTTDPQQVIQTIHSRVQLKIEVRKKSVDELAERLLEISQKESLTVSMDALKVIAKKGDRVPRECINLLESIAKNYGGQVTMDTVRAGIGDVSSEIYVDYFKAANSSLGDIMRFNQRLKENDVNIKQFMIGLIRFVLDACYVRNGINMEDYSVEFAQQAAEIFKQYKSSHFDTALQIIESASRSISDDDTKNELTITTTALRLGKVNLLAQGLVNEPAEAEKENKMSVIQHQKMLEQSESKQFERIREHSPTKEHLAETFTEMTEVIDSVGLLNRHIEITGAKAPEPPKENSRQLDKEELLRLMGE